MDPDARAEKLALMLEDRLARSGKPVTSRDLVKRSVIASQRLAGIDARLWVGDKEPEEDDEEALSPMTVEILNVCERHFRESSF